MNEYDSDRILDFTKSIGYELTKDPSMSDCYIMNTCHIREKATEKVYHDVGRVKKLFRNKKKPILIIAGCVAQAEGDLLLKKEKYIDGVIGPQSYHLVNDIIRNVERTNNKFNFTEFETIEKFDKLKVTKNSKNSISTFLTIQEGCDKFCKFCVVPYTRGSECSRPFGEIILEAKQLVDNGSNEITLLGQNVNAYQNKSKKISDLIYELDKIKNLKRIRYTTSHPKDMSKDLIDVHKDCEKLMPLLHLPIQTGSTKMLKEMNRKHTVDDYLNIINKLIKAKPTIKFSSDFIIGYPGENDEDFKKTIELMKQVEFINSYSFVFSPRPGTPAGKLTLIDNVITKERLIEFQDLAHKIKMKYRKSLINKKIKVLFENKTLKENKYFGRDEHNNSVVIPSEKDLTGQVHEILISECNQNTLFGKTLLNDKNNVVAA
jgi:tRNA-2-methylthio-N6-dimethylallyladenosine synthase